MNLSHLQLRHAASKLVAEDPTQAIGIIVRCCSDHGIRNEVEAFWIEWNMQHGSMHTFNNPSAYNSQPSAPSLGSSEPESPTNGQRLSNRRPSTAGGRPPPTPAASVSVSGKSTSSKIGTECISIAFIADGQIEQEVVRMRPAQIKHSLIREDVFNERFSPYTSIDQLPEDIHIPRPGSFTGSGDIILSQYVRLTWGRANTGTTHKTTFFLAPGNLLDVDIILGYQDSGEGFQRIVSPQPQIREPGLNFGEYTRQPDCTAQAASYHHSSMRSDGAANATPVQPIVEAFLHHQHGGAIRSPPYPQRSPAMTQIHSPRTPGIDHLPPHESATASYASTLTAEHTSNAENIRLSCVWSQTTKTVGVDLDAAGNNLYTAVLPLFKRQKGVLDPDRENLTILFQADKRNPDAGEYSLSLSEEALGTDWEDAVEWLREHKREKPPHIYGKIEHDEG